MNHFTKEELQLLHAFMYEFVPKFDDYEVFKKIQSMIDKYCEHKETYTDYDSQPERCKKCLDVVE